MVKVECAFGVALLGAHPACGVVIFVVHQARLGTAAKQVAVVVTGDAPVITRIVRQRRVEHQARRGGAPAQHQIAKLRIARNLQGVGTGLRHRLPFEFDGGLVLLLRLRRLRQTRRRQQHAGRLGRLGGGGDGAVVFRQRVGGVTERDGTPVHHHAGGVTGAAHQVVGAAHANVDGRRDQV